MQLEQLLNGTIFKDYLSKPTLQRIQNVSEFRYKRDKAGKKEEHFE